MKRENEFLYLELAAMLRSLIHSGLAKPRSFLLSESEMCRKYNVSRTSVRKALNLLLEEGIIVKMHGKGTMVSPDFTPPDEDGNTLVIVTPFPSNYAHKALPILIRIFEQRHPGMKVKTLSIPYDAETFTEDMQLFGVKPDLLLIMDRDFQQIRLENFASLDELSVLLQEIPQAVREAFKRKDRLYAIPVTYSPVFLAYNPDLFDQYKVEAPRSTWSLEQLLAAARRLTQDTDGDGLKEIYGFAVNSQLNRWAGFLLDRLPAAQDSQSRDSKSFDWDKLKDTLDFLQAMIYRHRVSPVYTVSNLELTVNLFEKGHIAMMIATTLVFGQNSSMYGMTPFPFGKDGTSLLIANAMLVPRLSDKQELAKLFLSLSLEPEVQREIALAAGLLALSTPLNREILQESRLEALGIMEGWLENGKFVHQFFNDPEQLDELEEEMKYFWAGLEKSGALVDRLRTLRFFNNEPSAE